MRLSATGRRQKVESGGLIILILNKKRNLADHHALRQFFPAIDFVEKSHCTLVAGMLARGLAKRLQPYRQLGATVFELVIALTKALSFLRRGLVRRGFGS